MYKGCEAIQVPLHDGLHSGSLGKQTIGWRSALPGERATLQTINSMKTVRRGPT